jgi:hypothetical protein
MTTKNRSHDPWLICRECAMPMYITDTGVSHHIDVSGPGGIDHDADIDHTPIPLDEEEQ